MTLPPEYEEHFRGLYQRTYQVLLTAGCDDAQAQAIARERVLLTAETMLQKNDPQIVILR